MKKLANRALAVMLALALMGGAACSAEGSFSGASGAYAVAFEYKNSDLNPEWSASEATLIALSGPDAVITGGGAMAADGVITISADGDYILSGDFQGRVIVSAGDNDKVRLVLDGAAITSQDSAAIYCESGDKLTITTADGSDNAISSGDNLLTLEDGEELDAAVYSKSDLVLNGGGTLAVTSSAGNGVKSKDDLIITGGALDVTAALDGLRGKDAVKICGGAINVDAQGDGIKSNNSEDAERGFVSIDGGTINVTSGEDGIQAETTLQVTGGTVNVTSGGGAASASSHSGSQRDMGGGRGMGGFQSFGQTASDSDEASAKGLKAASLLAVYGGTLDVDSADDALHTNGDLLVSGGYLELASGDDGLHADADLEISGGTVYISESYEGIEAANITISGGDIDLTASDDGLNAAGGNDSSSFGGMRGGFDMFASGDYSIVISGGKLRVNASGDGIDSNGTLSFDGGETYVSGPTDNGNGALDSAGTISMNGGVLVAAGSTGMAQAPTNLSQCVLTVYANGSGGQEITVKDAGGKEILSYTPEKAWQSLIVSTTELVDGETYTVYVNGSQVSTGSASMSSSASGGFFGGMGGGGMGGGGRRR